MSWTFNPFTGELDYYETGSGGPHTHPASQVTAGTFAAGNFQFQNNLGIGISPSYLLHTSKAWDLSTSGPGEHFTNYFNVTISGTKPALESFGDVTGLRIYITDTSDVNDEVEGSYLIFNNFDWNGSNGTQYYPGGHRLDAWIYTDLPGFIGREQYIIVDGGTLGEAVGYHSSIGFNLDPTAEVVDSYHFYGAYIAGGVHSGDKWGIYISGSDKNYLGGNLGLDAGSYINFGATFGSSGYGFRDNSGAIEYKDSGGSWIALNSIGVPSNPFTVGTDDTTYGSVYTYGQATGSSQGGIFRVYLAADYDVPAGLDYFQIQAFEDDLLFGPNTDPDAMKLDSNNDLYVTGGGLIVYGRSYQALTIGSGYPDRDYCITFNGEDNDGVLTWMEDEDYFAFADDIMMGATERVYIRNTNISVYSANVGYLDLSADSGIRLNNSTKIGAGGAGVDYTLTFDGETADGVITWMEDEDYFKFSDDIFLNTTEKLYLYNTSYYIYGQSTEITVYSDFVRFQANALNTDITIYFDATTYSGQFKWMEDEDYFLYSDDIIMSTTERVYFRDLQLYIYSGLDGDLDLGADSMIRFYRGSSLLLAVKNGYIEIGSGETGVDYYLMFNGETTDGYLTWMEDEGSFAISGNVRIYGDSSYLNFGTTDYGLTGYGFRSNSGAMEYKDSAGSWIAFNTLGGGGGAWSSGGGIVYLATETNEVRIGAASGGTYNGNLYFITDDEWPNIQWRSGTTVDAEIKVDCLENYMYLNQYNGAFYFQRNGYDHLSLFWADSASKLWLGQRNGTGTYFANARLEAFDQYAYLRFYAADTEIARIYADVNGNDLYIDSEDTVVIRDYNSGSPATIATFGSLGLNIPIGYQMSLWDSGPVANTMIRSYIAGGSTLDMTSAGYYAMAVQWDLGGAPSKARSLYGIYFEIHDTHSTGNYVRFYGSVMNYTNSSAQAPNEAWMYSCLLASDGSKITDAVSYRTNIAASGGSSTGFTTVQAAYWQITQSSSGEIDTAYMLRCVYSGTITTAWGIHITGEDSNYLSGFLGVGVTPDVKLDVYEQIAPVAGSQYLAYFQAYFTGTPSGTGLITQHALVVDVDADTAGNAVSGDISNVSGIFLDMDVTNQHLTTYGLLIDQAFSTALSYSQYAYGIRVNQSTVALTSALTAAHGISLTMNGPQAGYTFTDNFGFYVGNNQTYGTITNHYLYYAYLSISSKSAAAGSNVYGFYFNGTTGGKITTMYGFYTLLSGATTMWGIYLSASTPGSLLNFIDGRLGVNIDPTSYTGNLISGSLMLQGSSRYLNFGTTESSGGYGFRDNSGAMEYKDSAGSWIAFNSISGGSTPDISQSMFEPDSDETIAASKTAVIAEHYEIMPNRVLELSNPSVLEIL